MGAEATLMGWVHRVRDLGSLIFVDIRDRYGVTQVVARDDDALLAQTKRLRPEYVVKVCGTVERRSDETLNPKIETGEVEIAIREITVLSEARRPPFQIADETPVSEDLRLKYRYLDLRVEDYGLRFLSLPSHLHPQSLDSVGVYWRAYCASHR